MNYRNTRIYLRSLDLVGLCDQVLRELPTGFGFMADQLRRAASSVTLNFAEGCGAYGQSRAGGASSPLRKPPAHEVAAVFDVLDRFHAVRPELRMTGQDVCDHLAAMLRRFA